MPRLPACTPAELQEELDLIEWERTRALARPCVNPDGRQNLLASLDEWERDIRQQLAEATQPDRERVRSGA